MKDFLKSHKFDKKFMKLKKELKDKKIIIYGTGKLLDIY